MGVNNDRWLMLKELSISWMLNDASNCIMWNMKKSSNIDGGENIDMIY